MALKYLSHIETLNIDMQQNILSNVVIHPLTTATRPASPIVGQTIYNDTLKALEVWDGANWVSASGDITSITAGTGLSGGGSVGGVTLSIDYLGADNIILAAGALSGNIATTDYILISDTTDSNAKKALVSTLPFTDNLGTVTSVAATGADGIVVTGSPITTSGTLALSLSAVPNSSLANSTITINGTAVALGGSINVGDITSVTAGVGLSGGGTTGAVTLDLDFSELTDMTADITGATEFILQNGTIESRKAASEIKLSAFNNDQNWSSTVGTVTSIGISGNDGINVSGSPITSSGVITLGIDNNSIANGKLVNSAITIGTTVISLGGTSTLLNGLTSLDFAAGNRTIGASIGANNLTLGGLTSTVVIPGDLQVTGTTTTNNVEVVSTTNGVIFEGNTADDNEVTLLAQAVTADRTIVLPDASGTVALTSDTSNDQITITAGNALTGGGTFTLNGSTTTVTINHEDTSSQASVNNSGRTYIQDVTLDEYGHVTALTSSTETVVNTDNQLATAAALIDVSAMGANTTASFNHNLASKNLIVQIYDVTTGEVVFANIDHTSINSISVIFAQTPTNDIRVVVIDAKNNVTDSTVTYS